MNSIQSNNQFVDTFHEAMHDDFMSYVKKREIGGICCYIKGTKIINPQMRTKQIIQKSKECFECYSNASNGVTSDERIQKLTQLKSALNIFSTRIQRSIEKRWWYSILHFFGYQAKPPKEVVSLIKKISEQIASSTLLTAEEIESLTEFELLSIDTNHDPSKDRAKNVLETLLKVFIKKEYPLVGPEKEIVNNFITNLLLTKNCSVKIIDSSPDVTANYNEKNAHTKCQENGCYYASYEVRTFFGLSNKTREMSFSKQFLEDLGRDLDSWNRTEVPTQVFYANVYRVIEQMDRALKNERDI